MMILLVELYNYCFGMLLKVISIFLPHEPHGILKRPVALDVLLVLLWVL